MYMALYALFHPRIHAARRILQASILVFLFERVRKDISYACNNKHHPLEYALTVALKV